MDFNGDGIPDIAFLSFGQEDAGVLAGKGDGTFEPAVFFGANVFPIAIAAGTIEQGGETGAGAGEYGFDQRLRWVIRCCGICRSEIPLRRREYRRGSVESPSKSELRSLRRQDCRRGRHECLRHAVACTHSGWKLS